MKIQNFKGRWNPLQDRLLLEVIMSDQSVYSLWLTRKVTKQFLVDTEASVKQSLTKKFSQDAIAAVQEFETARIRGLLKRGGDEDKADLKPILGSTPVLVQSVQVEMEKKNRYQLRYLLASKTVFILSLNRGQLIQLTCVLEELQKSAQWDLQLASPSGESTSTSQPLIEQRPKKSLH